MGETIIEVIFNKLWEIIVWTFTGQNFLFVASVTGLWYAGYKKFRKIVLAKQSILIKKETAKENVEQNLRIDAMEEHMSELSDTLKDIRVDVIRMQILQGIQSESFSKSELTYFYDKYTALGGNSFVSVKVQAYLERDDIK